MKLIFTKMHGLGNDYIFITQARNPNLTVSDVQAMSAWLSRRRISVGADGVVFLCPCPDADFAMYVFNADGSRAQTCGNALRCAGLYYLQNTKTPLPCVNVRTMAGLRRVYPESAEHITVDMGHSSFLPTQIPLATGYAATFTYRFLGVPLEIHAVSMGNPHAVVFSDAIEHVDLETLGREIQRCDAFLEQVNVEFVKLLADGSIRMRVYERGSGITTACGSGACAAVSVAVRCRLCARGAFITVRLDGGDLQVLCAEDDRIFLTGDAHLVYEGTVEMDDAVRPL